MLGGGNALSVTCEPNRAGRPGTIINVVQSKIRFLFLKELEFSCLRERGTHSGQTDGSKLGDAH